jgi:hypothetical protein
LPLNLLIILHAYAKNAAAKKLVMTATRADENYNVTLNESDEISENKNDAHEIVEDDGEMRIDDQRAIADEISDSDMSVTVPMPMPAVTVAATAAAVTVTVGNEEKNDGKDSDVDAAAENAEDENSESKREDNAAAVPVTSATGTSNNSSAARKKQRSKGNQQREKPHAVGKILTRRSGKNVQHMALLDTSSHMRSLYPDHYSGIDPSATTAVVLEKTRRGKKRNASSSQ